jgi:anti-sigma factor RsiW
MTHPGHHLSALIDGELDAEERDRVLVHLAGCTPCREDAVALRTLKRRMNALGEAAADAALTRRLIGLGQPDAPASPGTAEPGQWPASEPLGSARSGREVRPAWYVAVGATALCVVGVGAAAFLAGGGAEQPEPRVTPAVDTYLLQHNLMDGVTVPPPPGHRAPSGKRVSLYPP